jgi:hypothetical protein
MIQRTIPNALSGILEISLVRERFFTWHGLADLAPLAELALLAPTRQNH